MRSNRDNGDENCILTRARECIIVELNSPISHSISNYMIVLFHKHRCIIYVGLMTLAALAVGGTLAFAHTLASADAIARKEAKACGIERISVSEIPQEIFHASRIFEAS